MARNDYFSGTESKKEPLNNPFPPAIIFQFFCILSRITLYYHGNPGLLRESILLPDSTIFSPIAILSATSKNTKIWGSPTIPVNPTKPKKPS
jgi:hypothetical protein